MTTALVRMKRELMIVLKLKLKNHFMVTRQTLIGGRDRTSQDEEIEAAVTAEAVVVDFHINEVEELAVITIVDSVECVMCVNPSFIMRTRVQFELHSLETIQLLSMFSISQMRLNRMKR